MSSLENQLKRLRIPGSSSLETATKFKKRTSFLFDPKEASDIDNETVFALAQNGLEELKLVDSKFEAYEALLFNQSSKNLDRGLQSQQVNDKLGSYIKDYLLFLSPYILLKPSQKTLEWLIRRYQVHLYNVDDMLACVFPYHQSNLFARVVQLLNITNTKWSWLSPVQKSGCPLPHSTIIQHCISNHAFLSFLSGILFYIEEKNKNGYSGLKTFSAFYASTAVGVVHCIDKISEDILSLFLSQIIHCLKSHMSDLKATAYMIIGQLTTKCVMELNVVESLLKTMCKNSLVELAESLLMCINCLCASYNLSKFPKVVYNTIFQLPNVESLFSNLSKRYEMDDILKVLLMDLVQRSVDNKTISDDVILRVLENVDIHMTTRMDIMRFALSKYLARRSCENDAMSTVETKIKIVLKIVENRWPGEFDKVIQEYLVNMKTSEVSEVEKSQTVQWIQDFVSMMLSNISNQVVSDSGSTLIIAIHHPEAEHRKLALKKIAKILKNPVNNAEDYKFLKESLLVKLNDEDPTVVVAVLQLKQGLINVLGSESLVSAVFRVMDKSSRQWAEVFSEAVNLLLMKELLKESPRVAETILFQLLPFIFFASKHVDRAKLVAESLGESLLKSHWIVKCLQRKTVKEAICRCSEEWSFEELAGLNVKIIQCLAQEMSSLKHESVMENLNELNDVASNRENCTCWIMFFMLWSCYISICDEEKEKFAAISAFLPRLLTLVNSAIDDETVKKQNKKTCHELDRETVGDCEGISVELLAEYLRALKRKKEKNISYVASKIFVNIVVHVVGFIAPHKHAWGTWWETTKNDEYTKMLFSIVDMTFKGLARGHTFLLHDEVNNCFKALVKTQFPEKLCFLHFLTLLWSSSVRFNSQKEQDILPIPNALVVNTSLRVASTMMQTLDEQQITTITSDNSPVLPSLLVCLMSPVELIRQSALDVIFGLVSVSQCSDKITVMNLAKLFVDSTQEIVADEAFISCVLQRHLQTNKSSDKKKSRKREVPSDILAYLLRHTFAKDTPSYIVRSLLKALVKVDSEQFIIMGKSIFTKTPTDVINSKEISYDESIVLLQLIKKFTPRTAHLFAIDVDFLEIFLQLLERTKPGFPGHMTPQEAILNQITAEYFASLNQEDIQSQIFNKLIDVLLDTDNLKISTKIKTVLKQIPVSSNVVLKMLNNLMSDERPKQGKRKKSKDENVDESRILFLPHLQKTIVMIEMLHSKDNFKNAGILLPALFKILSVCVEMQSPNSVDYLKQILLSTILKTCQSIVGENKLIPQGVLNEDHFSVEQIVHCIRVSENPQTHHHALSLLAIAAKLFPEKVLHNVMSIFTFMGVKILRQDDSYSFQIIQQTVEAVIPELLQGYKNKPNGLSQVTKVMRVFVDAYPHIPEHRRLPVFVHLLTTLGAPTYVHVCLALFLGKISSKDTKSENKESCLAFCSFLCAEFSLEIQMKSLVSLLEYLATIPEQKPEGNNRKRYVDSSGIVFDVNTHSNKELHEFKLSGLELMLNVLSDVKIVSQSSNEKTTTDGEENMYYSLLETCLAYIIRKSHSDKTINEATEKFIRVLLHKIYQIIEKVCDLLPQTEFISITSQLLHDEDFLTRRKCMDLFCKRMLRNTCPCNLEETEKLLSLLDAILPLIQDTEGSISYKQSLFKSVVVISKLLDADHNSSLKKVFPVAIEVVHDGDVKIASTALHCLAELCSLLKVHTIPFVPKLLLIILQILQCKERAMRSQTLWMNCLMLLQNIINDLPNFLSPYLKDIILQLVGPNFASFDERGSEKNSIWRKQISSSIVRLRGDIAVRVKPRILIPKMSKCLDEIVSNEQNNSLTALFELVDNCVTNMTKEDVANHHNELLSMFVSALDYCSRHVEDSKNENSYRNEESVIGAFISLIMRLSESLFRPMFLKLVDWATKSSAPKQRLLVFYRLADRMAEKLKGLFVLFAGYLVKNAAIILDGTNSSKNEKTFFSNEYEEEEAIEKSSELLDYVLDCLYKCFLYDNQRFVNRERFDRMVQPLVDQIENLLGHSETFDKRISHHLAPCISQFAVAAGQEIYWKPLNHQVCLKTRHSSPQVRLAALKVIQELNRKLGEEYLSLLPEIIPFLAELMEDESFEVEQKCQHVISEMEEVLGESLQKYF